MSYINDLIVKTALSWEGEKETKNNSGFKDEEFQKLMEEVGWQTGQAWCSYFFERVWKSSYSHYKSSLIDELDKLCDASAVATFRNFSRSKDFGSSQIPQLGAGIFFRHYKEGENGEAVADWTGHAGIVIALLESPREMQEKIDNRVPFLVGTIEGNTNVSGGREGIEVGRQNSSILYTPKPNSLVPLGFINPLVDQELELFVQDI